MSTWLLVLQWRFIVVLKKPQVSPRIGRDIELGQPPQSSLSGHGAFAYNSKHTNCVHARVNFTQKS